MNSKAKWKACGRNEISIVANVVHIGPQVELALWLGSCIHIKHN
jgi:hypothetical protein